MSWNLEEAILYFKSQGAPKDQTALIGLLREVQQENNGTIPAFLLGQIAQAYAIKESFLLAIIRRIPSLRVENSHCMELCAGPNCGKHIALADYAETLLAESGHKFILKYSPCMRMCGKGPNLKWNGVLYHKADEALFRKLLKDAGIEF